MRKSRLIASFSGVVGWAAAGHSTRSQERDAVMAGSAGFVDDPFGVFASKNGLALFLVLRVPGAAINQAQREAALIRSTFTKSTANKPLS
jgi:hypothetical protein